MTKTEIIKETAKYYSEDTSRRSLSASGSCFYYLKDKKGKVKKCAVGRCMNKEGIQQFGDSKSSAEALFIMEGDSLLKDKYKGHNAKFWDALQVFHDMDYNWDENKLSVKGEIELNELLAKYKD